MTPQGFSVIRCNIGHWDIVQGGRRVFRLRGGPGSWWVSDERPNPHRIPNLPPFREQSAAMSWICAELMQELIIAEGQQFETIGSWNVS